jgi:predicted component of type VI protein secretion system
VPSLVAKNGPLAGQRLDVEDELTFGRLDADVVVDDAELSRRHAVFRVVDGTLEVEDLGSTNGTFVEGRRIGEPTRIEHGTRVKLGISLFVAEVEPVVQTTRVREIPDAGATRLRETPQEPGATVLRQATEAVPPPPAAPSPPPAAPSPPPAAPSPPPAAPAPAPAAAAAPAAPTPVAVTPGAGPQGVFAPPSSRRGGLATRSWVPVVLSYGSAIATAAALVVYFATR